MKPNTRFTQLFTGFAAAVLSFSFLSDARAGDPLLEDIIIFRSAQSLKYTRYFQTSVSTPNAKVRGSERVTGYVILNMATGEFREVEFWTETEIDEDGKRVRVKLYQDANADNTAAAMFETGPVDRRNYFILSLFGSGKGENYSFNEGLNNDFLLTDVNSETLEGVLKVQKIRTSLGEVECIAPSTIRGALGYETQRSEPDGRQSRYFNIGKRTLRIDKRRITEAKDANAFSVETFQTIVTDYLESRGYRLDPKSV